MPPEAVHWPKRGKATIDENKTFLLKYLNEGKFEDVLVVVDSESKKLNVEPGDHLLHPRSIFGLKSYDHHSLCVSVNDKGVEVIEYTGPVWGGLLEGLKASLLFLFGPNAFVFGKIIRSDKITFEQLKKKKTKKRIWPKELKRFPVEDHEVNAVVVERAKRRMKEEGRRYNLFSNNCESFVNWCKCGLNVSLQVKPHYVKAWEAVKTGVSGVYRGSKEYAAKKATPFLVKVTANLSDDIAGFISSPLSPVGFFIGGLIETGLLGKNIYDDRKMVKQNIMTERQFRVNTVSNTAKAFGRTSLGTAGAFIGSALGPVGTIVGGAIGATVGHFVGAAVGCCYKNASKIKQFVQRKVFSPVKRFFKSLFS